MYKYAVVDDIGKCYRVKYTTNCTCDKYHVPIFCNESHVSIPDMLAKYLDKYYYPIPQYIDGDFDFVGDWYVDFEHEIKVEEVAQ